MHLILSMMSSNINEIDNGVDEAGIIFDEGLSPGRVTCVGEQAVLGRQPTTVHDKIVKRKWSKADYKVAMECFLRAQKGGRGVGKRTLDLWLDRGMFDISENNLMNQIRVIKKKQWLTSVEIEEMKRLIENGSQEGVETDVGDESPQSDSGNANEQHDTIEREDLDQDNSNLTEEENAIVSRIKEVRMQGNIRTVKSLRNINKLELRSETAKVNGVLKHIETKNITETRDLLKAAAVVICERLGVKDTTVTRGERPWWMRRIEGDISRLRKDLSRLDAWSKGLWTRPKQRVKQDLERKYGIKQKGIHTVIEIVKQRILAKASKLKRYKGRKAQFDDNHLFNTNQRQFYRNLEGGAIMAENPNQEEVIKFWSDIWSKETKHNDKAQWIENIREKVRNTDQQDNITISLEDTKRQVNRLPNWKAPGPDGSSGFWIKNCTALHEKISIHLNDCLEAGSVPNWMVEGKTTLLVKDKMRGTDAANYRPIACLNLLWKVLTGIFAEKAYKHLDDNSLLTDEQKGCKKNTRGTKDHLILDKEMLRNCRRRLTNLSMGWLDFKKAYDMVPHSWIIEVLKMFGITDNLVKLITASMSDWKTCIYANNTFLGRVKISRGIFQGDSFSPLLFVLALNPISIALKDIKMGYSLAKRGPFINHILFMDDIKLFGKTENEIDSLIQTVRICSQDIKNGIWSKQMCCVDNEERQENRK